MMADISMCQNKDCPLRKNCYRYRAIPSEFWQSYVVVEPEINQDGAKCDWFWDCRERLNVLSVEEADDNNQKHNSGN